MAEVMLLFYILESKDRIIFVHICVFIFSRLLLILIVTTTSILDTVIYIRLTNLFLVYLIS